ncbi:helix-turn-helix domain-containing protein [Streptomyces albogriseolus]|uniref:helix-turn-helix domain-containing protein n=1 Tax=Streptomyces albogriseolus TaxID=1887 RepID=UPI0037B69B56
MVGHESSGSEDSAVGCDRCPAGRAGGLGRRCSTAQALAQRSRIVLGCAEGHSITEVSRRLGASPDTVRTWRRLCCPGARSPQRPARRQLGRCSRNGLRRAVSPDRRSPDHRP